MELLSAIKVVIISGKVVAVGDFFSVRLKIVLLDDLPVGFDDGPYAAEMVLDEEVWLEDEDAVIQFFPDEESEGSGVLTSSSFPSREESLSETLVGCPTVFRRGQWMV